MTFQAPFGQKLSKFGVWIGVQSGEASERNCHGKMRLGRLQFELQFSSSLSEIANPKSEIGWAHQDSNLGPRDYESPALTAEL